MDRDELARRIYETAHLTGAFRLRSGRVSNEYFDKFRFEAEPAILAEIARRLRRLIPEGTEVLAGLELGGVPVTAMFASRRRHTARAGSPKARRYGSGTSASSRIS